MTISAYTGATALFLGIRFSRALIKGIIRVFHRLLNMDTIRKNLNQEINIITESQLPVQMSVHFRIACAGGKAIYQAHPAFFLYQVASQGKHILFQSVLGEIASKDCSQCRVFLC